MNVEILAYMLRSKEQTKEHESTLWSASTKWYNGDSCVMQEKQGEYDGDHIHYSYGL